MEASFLHLDKKKLAIFQEKLKILKRLKESLKKEKVYLRNGKKMIL